MASGWRRSELSDSDLAARAEERRAAAREAARFGEGRNYDPLWQVWLLNPAADMRAAFPTAVPAPTREEAARVALRRFPALLPQDVAAVEPLPLSPWRRNPLTSTRRRRPPPPPEEGPQA